MLTPLLSWGGITAPSPGSMWPIAGTTAELEVQGVHSAGNTSFTLKIENAYGEVYGTRQAYLRYHQPTAYLYAESVTDSNPPKVKPDGTWPAAGQYRCIMAYLSGVKIGETWIVCQAPPP